MAQTANRWKLGLFVAAAVATAFGALLWLGTAQFRREVRRVVAYFDESVQGLEVGAPVKFRGVPIGSVARIHIAPDRRHVEVDIDLHEEVIRRLHRHEPKADEVTPEGIPEDMRVQLVSAGVTGIVFLQVDFFDGKRYLPEKLPFETPEDYIPSAPSTIKSLSDSLLEVAGSMPRIIDNGNRLMARLDRLLQDIDAPGIAERLKRTLDRVDEKLAAVDTAGLVTRTAAALDDARDVLATARRLGDELRGQMGQVKADLARIESLAATAEAAIADAKVGETMAVVREATASVGEAGRTTSALADDLRAELASIREATAALRRLADLLERDPSALIHGKSPELPPGGNKP